MSGDVFSVMGRAGLGVHLLLKTLVKTDCESIHKSMKVFIKFPLFRLLCSHLLFRPPVRNASSSSLLLLWAFQTCRVKWSDGNFLYFSDFTSLNPALRSTLHQLFLLCHIPWTPSTPKDLSSCVCSALLWLPPQSSPAVASSTLLCFA